MELLLVAGILAVLAALAIPRLFGTATEAKIQIAKSQVGRNSSIAKALETFKWDIGRYPDTDEGLAALFSFSGGGDEEELWKGAYLDGAYEELRDPWGMEYEYKSPGDYNEDGYDLWCRGPNKKDDGGKEGSDDIKNWVEK